jgi:uncharacterized protein YggE
MESVKIAVQGTGSFFKQPERAIVTITVSQEHKKPQEATQTVVTLANALTSRLKALDTKEADAAITFWSSSSLSKYSYTPYHKDKPQDPMHRVSMAFTIKFQNFAKLAEVVTEYAAQPFVNVGQINWKLTDETSSRMQTAVRTMAVKDAVTKAKDYAMALGFKDVRVVNLQDNSGGGHQVMYGSVGRSRRARADQAEQEDIELTPEDVELSAAVSCEFVAV